MNQRAPELLAGALGNVDTLASGQYRHWEELVRRAREANLLGTLASRLAERGLLDAVPAAPRAHLVAARIQSQAQQRAVRREIRELARVLGPLGVPIVLLKGAAYLQADLPAARGRLFSDVDIMVPKDRLVEVESALMQSGFVTTHHHPYDQRYYREWMHELPPMQHVKRQTVLDVHHAIAPETSRVHPDSALLLRDALLLSGHPGFAVLAPTDMVVHCATHLFQDEEFGHGPRDLVDFDVLLRHFGADDAFWPELLSRSADLDLGRPLYYALRWTSRIHRTPIPPEIIDASARHAPPMPVRKLMDSLLGPALDPTAARASTRWARRALYVRGHWLKMPPHRLAWHLTVKALRRDED
ncbi:MAG TPA: nucleotidyltransferase family protein [Casimicrobiaceae bacterium]|nr:nucleotidyltransferase family protein [Casimicrobiaceae bacterium]